MDVNSKEFRHLLLVGLAESLGIHRNAFSRFKVVALGDRGARRLEMVDRSQAAATVQVAEASTGAVIVGVGYEIYTGSPEREVEIQERLNNMGGPASRMRATLVDILTMHGVSLLAVQVTYPPAKVSTGMLATLAPPIVNTLPPASLPAASAPVPTPVPTPAPAPFNPAAVQTPGPLSAEKPKPSSDPESFIERLQSFLTLPLLGCIVLLIILCSCFCCARCRVVRSKSPAADERLSRAEAGADVTSAGRVANSAKNAGPRYPAGYEPVNRTEDQSLGGSVSSANRPPSIASDSSEAAGLRLLGNDGM